MRSATSSAVARPTTPSARSTSKRTSLVSASRLAVLAANRSSAIVWIWAAVAPLLPTSRFATFCAFFFDASVTPSASSRYARHASCIVDSSPETP